MSYFFFLLVNLLGVMSPGPDFAIVTRYALKGSRKAALEVTLGISTALIIHITYCLLGAAVFLQKSPHLFLALQILGALYLGYLGAGMLSQQAQKPSNDEEIPSTQAFWEGFWTNLLNPKATLFILSLLSQFVTPETSTFLKLIYGATIPLVAFAWFGLLSITLTHARVYSILEQYQGAFVRLMGILLIGLSCWIVVTGLRNL
jgi:threonine/homoserine/homoserine lactone efflux protein